MILGFIELTQINDRRERVITSVSLDQLVGMDISKFMQSECAQVIQELGKQLRLLSCQLTRYCDAIPFAEKLPFAEELLNQIEYRLGPKFLAAYAEKHDPENLSELSEDELSAKERDVKYIEEFGCRIRYKGDSVLLAKVALMDLEIAYMSKVSKKPVFTREFYDSYSRHFEILRVTAGQLRLPNQTSVRRVDDLVLSKISEFNTLQSQILSVLSKPKRTHYKATAFSLSLIILFGIYAIRR